MRKTNMLYAFSIIVPAAYLLEFFGTGFVIYHNLYYTFAALPYLLLAVALVPLALSLVNFYVLKRGWLSVILIAVSAAMALGHFLLTAFLLSKLVFVLVAIWPFLAVAFVAVAVAFFLFIFPRLQPIGKRVCAYITLVALVFAILFGAFGLNFFSFTSDGVVFAVEDEYQIAWSTSVNSTGCVEVGGKKYYDSYAGENSVSRLHKVSVPMSELDSAKQYKLYSTPVYREAAYLSISGRQRSRTYSFRPVDGSDGLQIYNISDNHECITGAGKAGRYFKDKLDILLLNGDHVNEVSTVRQVSLIYKLASEVTGGQRPVIFTRGNHECNGKLAADLYKYVASYNGNFYYKVKLGGAYMLVLDTNNDMPDGKFLIKPQANFEEVRKAQSLWLASLDDWGEGCEYKLLFAHMAFALKDYSRFPDWTAQLNAATDGKFDLCVSGHSHCLDYAEAGTGTATSYPVVRGSIRNNNHPTGDSGCPFLFTGTAIECKDGTISVFFTNNKGTVLKEIKVR